MPSHVLALETATRICSVAVFVGDRCCTVLTLDRPRRHSERLVPLVQRALAEADVGIQALDAVAVSAGPGSYTGLRIGVSTAKGLALTADARLIGVSTLDALAMHAALYAPTETPVVVAQSARQGERYLGAYRVGDGQTIHSVAVPTVLADDDLKAWWHATGLPLQAWAVGDDVPDVANVLPEVSFHTLPYPAVGPSARMVGHRAIHQLARGETHDIATFEPFYLKAYRAKKHAEQA